MADKTVIKCDSCGKQFQISASMVGKKVRCPCGNVITVPEGGSAEDTARKWYYAKSGERFGPVDLSGLKQLIRDSLVTREDYVWAAGMESWEAAGEIAQLAEAFAPPEQPEQEPAPPEPSAPAAPDLEEDLAAVAGVKNVRKPEPEAPAEGAEKAPAEKAAAPEPVGAPAPEPEPAQTGPAPAPVAEAAPREEAPAEEREAPARAAPRQPVRAAGPAKPAPTVAEEAAGPCYARWLAFFRMALNVLAIVLPVLVVGASVVQAIVLSRASSAVGGSFVAVALPIAVGLVCAFAAFVFIKAFAVMLAILGETTGRE